MLEQVKCDKFMVLIDLDQKVGTFEHMTFGQLWAGVLVFQDAEPVFHAGLGETLPLSLKRFTGVNHLPPVICDALRVHGFIVNWALYA